MIIPFFDAGIHALDLDRATGFRERFAFQHQSSLEFLKLSLHAVNPQVSDRKADAGVQRVDFVGVGCLRERVEQQHGCN